MHSDPLSERRIASLHPKLRDEAILLFEKINNEMLTGRAKMRVTCGFRSVAEQNVLYSMGRTRPGKIVTNAQGGQSVHNYGLAMDFCLILDGGKYASWDTMQDFDHDGKADWMEIVGQFKEADWEWAGDWKTFREYCHVQKTFGLSVSRLAKLPLDKEGFVRLPV